jgi:hypothetical protein
MDRTEGSLTDFANIERCVNEVWGEIVVAANQAGYRQLTKWLVKLDEDVLVGIEGPALRRWAGRAPAGRGHTAGRGRASSLA